LWPSLAFAEANVVIRVNDHLIVVEAQYRSNRHDLLAGDDPLMVRDQYSSTRAGALPGATRTGNRSAFNSVARGLRQERAEQDPR